MKIENLKPATSYTFRIRAKNEVGVGNKIEKVITTTNFCEIPFCDFESTCVLNFLKSVEINKFDVFCDVNYNGCHQLYDI